MIHDLYTLSDFSHDVDFLTHQLMPHRRGWSNIYGIPRGGIALAIALSGVLRLPMTDQPGIATLIVDDLVDSGSTISRYRNTNTVAVLIDKQKGSIRPAYAARVCHEWVTFFWEKNEEGSIEDSVLRQLQFIGEDPTREGLKETPARVVKAWGELFAGYKRKPEEIFKVFSDGACDEMVLLRDVEFYSTCEHHLLPFFGKAHIAYIPDGKVIGVSKLARLLEIFARRAQIQERIGQQITDSLMSFLKPKGAACVLEAQHFCMTSRGVQKQDSVMVTSSLTGVFRERPEVRAELMGLIR